MKSLSLNRIELLPLLLVIKVYTSFIMNASPYAIPYLGMLIYAIVFMTAFICRNKYFEGQTISAKCCFICLFVYFSFVALFDDFDYGKNTIYDIIFLAIFIYMKQEFKMCTLQYFFSFGTILLVFSIIEYILYMFFNVGYTFGSFDRGESDDKEMLVIQGVFNYYSFDSRGAFRFQSLFREPGILGQCAGMVLFMWGKLDIKKCAVWLIAGLMSLSLFFYIFLFLSLVYNFFSLRIRSGGQRMKISHMLLFVFVICAGYLLIPEDLQFMVTDRVENMTEDKIDNRSTDTMNYELERMFCNGQYLLGMGAHSFYQKDLAWGNTGIKADIYKFGIIGVAFFILCFWLLIKDAPVKRVHKLLCLLLFCLLYYNGDIKFSLHINILLISFLLMELNNETNTDEYVLDNNYS